MGLGSLLYLEDCWRKIFSFQIKEICIVHNDEIETRIDYVEILISLAEILTVLGGGEIFFVR